MRKHFQLWPFYALFSCIFFVSCGDNTSKKSNGANAKGDTAHSALQLIRTVALPSVKGGFDLMAVDNAGQRLFVAAEDNHSLEVIDLKNFKPITSVPNLNEPKWIVYRPEMNKIFVSTGGDGKVTEFDATTYQLLKSYAFKEKCNNLRFDSLTKELFIGIGKTLGSLGTINIAKGTTEPEISLPHFPKQFELDDTLIYVNIPSKNLVAVVNRKTKQIQQSWPVTQGTENVPMAFDKATHRLFIGCNSGSFLIYSTQTGKLIQSLPIGKEADGIYVDAKRNRIYVTCGEGNIQVIDRMDADHYQKEGVIATRKGAGTSLFSSALDLYFVALPQTSSQKAEIRIYQPLSK